VCAKRVHSSESVCTLLSAESDTLMAVGRAIKVSDSAPSAEKRASNKVLA